MMDQFYVVIEEEIVAIDLEPLRGMNIVIPPKVCSNLKFSVFNYIL